MDIVVGLVKVLYAITVLPILLLLAYTCLLVAVIAGVAALVIYFVGKKNEAEGTDL